MPIYLNFCNNYDDDDDDDDDDLSESQIYHRADVTS